MMQAPWPAQAVRALARNACRARAAVAEIEALRERRNAGRVEHELRAAGLARDAPHRVEQLRADAAALHGGVDHQIVDIHEAAIQQVGQRPVPGETDDAARVGRGKQPIAVGALPGDLRGERVRVGEVRAQLAHHVEGGQQRLRRVEMSEA